MHVYFWWIGFDSTIHVFRFFLFKMLQLLLILYAVIAKLVKLIQCWVAHLPFFVGGKGGVTPQLSVHFDNAVNLEATPNALPCPRKCRAALYKLGGNLDCHFTPAMTKAPSLLKQLLLHLIGNHDMEWGINPRDCCWLRSRSLKEHGD